MKVTVLMRLTDEFYENWIYEVNAFNIVFEGMGQLLERSRNDF